MSEESYTVPTTSGTPSTSKETEKKPSDKEVFNFKQLLEYCMKDCDSKRKYYMPVWKRNEYYWNDIQDIWWDPNNSDWLTYDYLGGQTEFEAIRDNNKIVNTYRADGESMIAAGTVGNLTIRFYPGDASKIEDIERARSYEGIAEYLQIKNNIRDLRRRAFTIRYNQGLIGSYLTYEKGPQYGTYTVREFETKRTLIMEMTCEQCGNTDNKEYSSPLDKAMEPMQDVNCPTCNQPMTRGNESYRDDMEVTSEEEDYKGCVLIELFSPLEMRVPFYARTPKDVNYVIVQKEVALSKAKSMFNSDYMENLSQQDVDSEEAMYRAQADFFEALPSDKLVTVTWMWLEPDVYNMCDDPSVVFKNYKDGAKVTFIGDKLLKCEPEVLKKRWSFISSPTDSHVYCRPLGQGSIPIQDMENDLVYLVMDTIKHAVGDTFVDGRIINSKVMQRNKQNAGLYYPVFPQDQRPIGEHFFSTKNATLSREVEGFSMRLTQYRQHVSGVLPSIFGGRFTESGSSQTFGEYKLSRDQALQRISMPTDNVDDFLAETIFKATELYADKMAVDETYSVSNGGGFSNKALRKPPANGRISRIELMKSEQFPTTWEQQRAFMLELLDKKIDPLTAAILAPLNMGISQKVVGIPGMKIPGSDDRNKQLREIQQLIDASSADGKNPSIIPDFDVDNDDMHIQTIIDWAVSPEGLDVKQFNPSGYMNVILHLKSHQSNAAMKMQQENLTAPQPAQGAPKPNETPNPPPTQ